MRIDTGSIRMQDGRTGRKRCDRRASPVLIDIEFIPFIFEGVGQENRLEGHALGRHFLLGSKFRPE